MKIRRVAWPYRQWGVNTYPVEYAYDEAGRMISLKTFRTVPGAVNWDSVTWPNPSGGDVTQWGYDTASGLLEQWPQHVGEIL